MSRLVDGSARRVLRRRTRGLRTDNHDDSRLEGFVAGTISPLTSGFGLIESVRRSHRTSPTASIERLVKAIENGQPFAVASRHAAASSAPASDTALVLEVLEIGRAHV